MTHSSSLALIVKAITKPDFKSTFLDGSSRDVITLSSSAIGIGTYQPGWQWSQHAGAISGKPSKRHIGFILSGQMMVRDNQGLQTIVNEGEAFEVTENHDAWVIGDQPCIALDFSPLS